MQRERERVHYSRVFKSLCLSHTLGPCAGGLSRADAESNGVRELVEGRGRGREGGVLCEREGREEGGSET